MAFVQATAVAIDRRAILLVGPPGSGKSDLALRMIARGATLIGDDAVDLSMEKSQLLVSPLPDRTQRLLVAHIGAASVPLSGPVPAALVVDLDPAMLAPDRSACLDRFGPVDGHYLPRIALPAFHASTPAMLLLALERWGH